MKAFDVDVKLSEYLRTIVKGNGRNTQDERHTQFCTKRIENTFFYQISKYGILLNNLNVIGLGTNDSLNFPSTAMSG